MTLSLQHWLPLVAFLAASISATPAAAQQRTWIAQGLEGDIVVTDCGADCGDDLGIIIACQGKGGNALIRVPFAAADRPPDHLPAEITFRLDDDTYRFDVAIEDQGLVGFVPTFMVRPNNPLIASLQSAGQARISFAGRETRIGLRGSRSALDIFKAHCGWTGVAFDPAPIEPLVATQELPGSVAPPGDELTWFTSEYESEGGAPTMSLTYGIPETDAILVATSCATGAGVRSVRVDLSLDTGAALPGSAAEAVIRVGGRSFTYAGKVHEESSEYAGLSIELGSRAPLWNALRGGGDFTVGIADGASVGGSADNAAAAVEEFTAACFKAGAAASDGPIIKLNLGASDKRSAPATGEPLVKLDFGAVPPNATDSGAAPAAPAKSLVTLKLTPSLSPTQPATLAPAYLCDDGTIVKVTVGAADKVAQLQRPGAPPLVLSEVAAPFGRKFSNAAVTLHVSESATIQITQAGDRQLCQLQ